MKNLQTLTCIAILMMPISLIKAQEPSNLSITTKAKHPIYDLETRQLNNIDSISGFDTKIDRLKITGTIYKNDGITPAKDIILYIEQPNENGDYIWQNDESMYHKAQIKTDADGRYTFYTFVPGAAYELLTFPRRRGMKQIHPMIKEPGKMAYNYDLYLFKGDPLMTKRCLKRFEKKAYKGLLTPQRDGNILVAQRDIVLD